jgi:hypothetical protein
MISTAYKQRVPVAEVDPYLAAFPVGRSVPLPDAEGLVHLSRVNSQGVVMDDPADGFATVTLNISY